jgi:hypothetical protein
MSDQHVPSQSKWRLRFSLLTVLLLTTIIAMAITITLLWCEIGPLRAEVRQLRSQLGELSIVDTETPYAIAIKTEEPDTWKWRVYLPPLPHAEYVLNCNSGLQDPVTSKNVDSLLEQYRRAGRNWSIPNNNQILSGEVVIEAKIVDREGYQYLQVLPYGGQVIGMPERWREFEDKPNR